MRESTKEMVLKPCSSITIGNVRAWSGSRQFKWEIPVYAALDSDPGVALALHTRRLEAKALLLIQIHKPILLR
jgi:hypothetical protein